MTRRIAVSAMRCIASAGVFSAESRLISSADWRRIESAERRYLLETEGESAMTGPCVQEIRSIIREEVIDRMYRVISPKKVILSEAKDLLVGA